MRNDGKRDDIAEALKIDEGFADAPSDVNSYNFIIFAVISVVISMVLSMYFVYC